MRRKTTRATAVATLGLLAGGCFHEQVPWPPTPGDVARINETADDNNWFRVEYVEPLATAQGVRVVRPVAIASVDDNWIAFRNAAGEVRPVPTPMVKGVTVKERAPGVGVGAAIGLGWGALTIGGLYLLSFAGPSDPGAPQSSCDDTCVAKTVVPILVVPAIIGAVVGYFIGGRRTYDMGSRLR